MKGPRRSGGFKDAFRHGFVFVYGTRGDAAENARAFDKVRFDAELFWIRGNDWSLERGDVVWNEGRRIP